MPTLPSVETYGRGVAERPTPSPVAASAAIRTGQVEAAVANVGEAISQIDDHMTKARNALQLSDALGAATEQLGNAVIKYGKDQDFATAQARFKAEAGTIGEGIAAGISDPRARMVFGEKFTMLKASQQLNVAHSAAKQEIDYGRAKLTENVSSSAARAAAEKDPLTRDAIAAATAESIDAMVAANVINDVAAKGYQKLYLQSYFMAKRDVDPAGALKELQQSQGKIDPLLESQLYQHLFSAAKPVLAEGVNKMLSFNPVAVTPNATKETLENLTAAITSRESGGNPNAVSVQGARGSRQIMPDTFAQYARPGESFDNEAHRIAASDRKLADDWTFYKGDVRKVAAAYIGGRGAVRDDGMIREDVKDALGTTPKAYAEQVAAMMGAVRQSALNTAIAGPNGALEEAIRNPERPIGDPVVDALPLDRKIEVLRAAQTQAHQGNAQARGAMAATVGDALASYQHGQTPQNVPSPQELIVALGPVDGMKAAFTLEQGKKFSEQVQSFQTMPASDILANVKASEPTPGPGSEIAWKFQDARAKAAEEVIRQREQNPAAVVLQGNAATRQLFDSVANAKTPEERATASQAYATSTLSEQTRLQIQKPSILTPQMVTQIGIEFSKPQTNQGNVVDGMAEQWESHWGKVVGELTKVLPPAAFTIANGTVTKEGVQLLSEAAKMKPEALRQGISDSDLKTVEDRLTKGLDKWKATLAGSGGGAETYNNFADSAKSLALMLAFNGMSIKDAPDKAVEMIVNNAFQYDERIRIPKKDVGGRVTTQSVKIGGSAEMREIADNVPLQLPDVQVKGVVTEDAMAQWKSTVRKNGVWITSPGNGGMTLNVESGGGVQVVKDAAGNPIRRTWKQLADVGYEMIPFTGSVEHSKHLLGTSVNVDANRP